MKSEILANIIESILFISGKEVAVKDISEKLGVTDSEVTAAAKSLLTKYGSDSGINLLIFNKKLQFCSNPSNAESVESVLNPIRERELSKSMLETAAIIAYKQPVTRLDLDQIRGCNSDYALQNLLKLEVVEVVGRKDTIGKPLLYGTTDKFLKRFQISSLDELPDYGDLMDKIKQLHGDDGDNYLFKKDVYDESKDPDLINANAEQSTFADTTDDIPPIENEDIPEFLKGEKIDSIKGEVG